MQQQYQSFGSPRGQVQYDNQQQYSFGIPLGQVQYDNQQQYSRQYAPVATTPTSVRQLAGSTDKERTASGVEHVEKLIKPPQPISPITVRRQLLCDAVDLLLFTFWWSMYSPHVSKEDHKAFEVICVCCVAYGTALLIRTVYALRSAKKDVTHNGFWGWCFPIAFVLALAAITLHNTCNHQQCDQRMSAFVIDRLEAPFSNFTMRATTANCKCPVEGYWKTGIWNIHIPWQALISKYTWLVLLIVISLMSFCRIPESYRDRAKEVKALYSSYLVEIMIFGLLFGFIKLYLMNTVIIKPEGGETRTFHGKMLIDFANASMTFGNLVLMKGPAARKEEVISNFKDKARAPTDDPQCGEEEDEAQRILKKHAGKFSSIAMEAVDIAAFIFWYWVYSPMVAGTDAQSFAVMGISVIACSVVLWLYGIWGFVIRQQSAPIKFFAFALMALAFPVGMHYTSEVQETKGVPAFLLTLWFAVLVGASFLLFAVILHWFGKWVVFETKEDVLTAEHWVIYMYLQTLLDLVAVSVFAFCTYGSYEGSTRKLGLIFHKDVENFDWKLLVDLANILTTVSDILFLKGPVVAIATKGSPQKMLGLFWESLHDMEEEYEEIDAELKREQDASSTESEGEIESCTRNRDVDSDGKAPKMMPATTGMIRVLTG